MDVKFKIEILSDRLYDHALRKSQNYDHLSAVMKRKSEADHPRTVVADSENSWFFFGVFLHGSMGERKWT